jgi:hypothetical protein
VQSGAKKDAEAAYAEVVRLLGDESTAQILLLQIVAYCRGDANAVPNPARPTRTLAAAYGRVCAIGEDMGKPMELLANTPRILMSELSDSKIDVEPNALIGLGEAAMRQDLQPLAYAISGAGLAQGAEYHARFLFLRVRSLPPWEMKRRNAGLAAASELARVRRDFDLLKHIGEWRDRELRWLDVPDQAGAAPDSAGMDQLIEQEIRAREFPGTPPDPDYDDDEDEAGEEICDCPKCRARREEIPPELAELIDQLGPEAVAEMLQNMFGAGKRKKRGRRSLLDDDDFPF